jgi:hypothetical protein
MPTNAFAKAAFLAALVCALPNGAYVGFPNLPSLPLQTKSEVALKTAAGDLLGAARDNPGTLYRFF